MTEKNRSGRGWGGLPLVMALLVLLLAAGVATSLQAGPEGTGPGRPGDDDSRREEIQETVEIYMIAKMKRFLGMTGEQERRVIPVVEELNSSRRELNRRRRLSIMRLRLLVEDDESQEQEISRVMDELQEMDGRFHLKEMKATDEIRAALSPRQQAKFIIFQERFRHEMQERLRRIQQGEGRGPGGGRRAHTPPGLRGPRR